ncbi:system killer suppression protein [Marimonas lutisalis]|uniref:system killer suppression protein n=1 Tax=Marimonas lutisalis TaxID=2545756 RepID=UPI00137613F3|nr:system killer suppression protein [Marimonas lutisalis]
MVPLAVRKDTEACCTTGGIGLDRYLLRNEMVLLLEISFKKRRLQKTLESESQLVRTFGDRMARTIMMRLSLLEAAPCLNDVPTTKPDRCHQLKEDRDEQFAVDLVHPQRLVFEVDHDPIPRLADGGINKKEVTSIVIIEVIDYH